MALSKTENLHFFFTKFKFAGAPVKHKYTWDSLNIDMLPDGSFKVKNMPTKNKMWEAQVESRIAKNRFRNLLLNTIHELDGTLNFIGSEVKAMPTASCDRVLNVYDVESNVRDRMKNRIEEDKRQIKNSKERIKKCQAIIRVLDRNPGLEHVVDILKGMD